MNLIKNKSAEINNYIKKGNFKKAQLILSPLLKRFPAEINLLQLQIRSQQLALKNLEVQVYRLYQLIV